MSHTFKIFVRCIGRCKDSQWTVVCLNYDLAAQADTFEEAKKLLDAQIHDYISEALSGEDRDHAEYLMNRRAPLSLWLLYGFAVLRERLIPKLHSKQRPFNQPLPLVPSPC